MVLELPEDLDITKLNLFNKRLTECPNLTKYKKYVYASCNSNNKGNVSLYDKKEFKIDKMAIFNAPYHAGLKDEYPIGLSGGFYSRNTKNWNYILFFNEIHKLEVL